MTSRQAGRRMSAVTKRAADRRTAGQRNHPVKKQNNYYNKNNKKNYQDADSLRPSERRSLIRLIVCGSLFASLVAVKLLLPERMAEFNQTLTGLLEQNMDVERVFSAVGRTVSGEHSPGELFQEVYQAVFQPDLALELEETASSVAKTAIQELPSPIENLQEFRPDAKLSDPELESDSGSGYIQYSQENLPESVSMEQEVLGFAYITPLQGVLTSRFGYREHPIEGEERFHYGLDIAAETGTPICCFADGQVTAIGESSSYGKYLIVAHGEEQVYETLYAHCSKITVTSGSAVTQGQTIAEVGQTGLANGPHLHFELHRGSVYLNPIYYVTLDET